MGRLPWFAPFFLRSRRLRARLLMNTPKEIKTNGLSRGGRACRAGRAMVAHQDRQAEISQSIERLTQASIDRGQHSARDRVSLVPANNGTAGH